MTEYAYCDFVYKLKKKPSDIKPSLTNTKVDLIHMILGLSGEVGELLDSIKKHVIYEQELDRDNVIEELGDIEFYLEGLRQQLFLSREMIIESNVEKLSQRYNSLAYSDQSAKERKDKKSCSNSEQH